MGLFDLFHRTDINQGVEAFHDAKDAVLLDVRTAEEYGQGHIPESKNVPLQRIELAERVIPNKDTPVFVYCLSGGRSSQAASALKTMGYTDVTNIGGISGWKGKVER